MTIQIKKEAIKNHLLFVRVEPKLFDQITILEKKNKVDRSTVIRRLIEIGLKNV